MLSFVTSVSIFRDKPTVETDVFNDEMMTDGSEAAAKQHDDTLGELGLVLLQNNVCFYSFVFMHSFWLIVKLFTGLTTVYTHTTF